MVREAAAEPARATMRPRRFRTPAAGQQGSILMPAALIILIGLVLLGGAQLGYFYYMKRELQKAADLAALTAAQLLGAGAQANCTAASAAAGANARANLGGNAQAITVTSTCHRWDSSNASLAPRFIRPIAAGERYNAVRVALSMPAPALVPYLGGATISVEAIGARPGEPVAAFSVGTKLIAAKPGVLTNLLSQVGLDLSGTSLVGYDSGLANVKITPAGLLQALGIPVPANISLADFNQLLAANTRPLGDVLNAVVTVAGRNELVAANVGLLQAIQTKLGISNLQVKLGSTTPGRSGALFANITSGDASSALNLELDALQVLSTAIGVGTGGHAVQGGTSVSLGGLVSVTPRFSVVEPPSIAIGGVGTTAYSAQVRVYAPIQISTASLPPPISSLLKVSIDLPITLDLVDGHGTLTQLCQRRDAANRDLANIAVTSSILKLCVGGPPPGAPANWPFSTSASCDQGLQPKKLLSVALLGAELASVQPNPPLVINALPANGAADFYVGQTQSVPATDNPLLLGTTVKNVTDALLGALLGNSLQAGSNLPGGTRTQVIDKMTQELWNSTATPACTDAISAQQNATGFACRSSRTQAALNQIKDAPTNLGGFLTGLPNTTANLLTSLVTLNVSSLLGNVVGLVNNLVGTVVKTLGDVVGALLPTNQCTTRILGIPIGGTVAGCMQQISNTLAATPTAGGPPNVVLGLVGFLLELLRPALDQIGTGLIKPLIENVIGLRVGQTDVRLMSMDCDGTGVQLVY